MKENLVILLGPTGVGKTKLSIDLAKELNGEIISCDSMQIYKHMDIGTDKIRENDMDGIKHHLLDMVELDEDYTVEDYKDDATRAITDINNRNKVPIVTGGTGLYINSLVYDLQFARVAPNEELREELQQIVDENNNQILHDKLEKIDPESAERIHPNDVKRVIRAIEIYKETGRTMTEYNKNFRKPVDSYNLSMIGLNMNRQRLYNRIDVRVEEMIEDGLVEEVKSILAMGYDKSLISLEGIGYKEIIMYLEGKMSLNDAVALVQQKSRNYAKRQLTWFRRDDRIVWFDKDDFDDEGDLKNQVVLEINKNLQVEN